MKKFFQVFFPTAFLVAFFALCAWAANPVPPITSFSFGFLTKTNAATARAYLEISDSSNAVPTANYDFGTNRIFTNLVALLSGQGQTNTASNLGTGAEFFKQKTGVDFEFRTMISPNGIITLNSTANEVELDVAADSISSNLFDVATRAWIASMSGGGGGTYHPLTGFTATNSAGTATIDWENETLNEGGQITVDWANLNLRTGGGVVLNWATKDLTGAWTMGGNTILTNGAPALVITYTNVTGNSTITWTTQQCIFAEIDPGITLTINLPNVTEARELRIKKGGSGVLTVTADTGDKINNLTTENMSDWEGWILTGSTQGATDRWIRF
jgi:hypothetical protein